MKKYTKRFVIGDIHGNYRGLLQCIERSGFNSATDQLIVLGDVVDGYPDTKECIDYLITIPNLILIIRNHCQWYIDWMKTGAQPSIWVKQGGQATLRSVFHTFNQSHLDFFNKGHYVYVDNNYVYTHGGLNLDVPLDEQNDFDLMWDRNMMEYAYNCEHTKSCKIPKKLQFTEKIFIGHTTTEGYGSDLPLKLCNVWALDTGCGWDTGKLTIMNVDTEQYWQSDKSSELYLPNQGRGY